MIFAGDRPARDDDDQLGALPGRLVQALKRAGYLTRDPRNLEVVPIGAGGGTDTMARLMGERLSATFGQQVLVDNKAGASGSIAATTSWPTTACTWPAPTSTAASPSR